MLSEAPEHPTLRSEAGSRVTPRGRWRGPPQRLWLRYEELELEVVGSKDASNVCRDFWC